MSNPLAETASKHETRVYDGSWTEYGYLVNAPVAK